MRALGNPRRKAPIEPKKAETTAPKAEDTTSVPADSSETFDESVVIN